MVFEFKFNFIRKSQDMFELYFCFEIDFIKLIWENMVELKQNVLVQFRVIPISMHLFVPQNINNI